MAQDAPMLKRLIAMGFKRIPPSTEYEAQRFKGEGTVVVYKSGRVLIQGTKEQVAQLKSLLSGTLHQELEQPIVGTDEALKGDTFGGLVVAGVRANGSQRKRLLMIGVADCKRLSDRQVSRLAKQIQGDFHWYCKSIAPREYNKQIALIGTTGLLNRLHAQCYSKLKTRESKHIVDRFPGCNVGDIAVPKAEAKFLEVAAASIIARHFAIEQIKQLSKKAGFKLPMGSTHVTTALQRLNREGKPLVEFAKLNFRNVNAIQKVYK